MLLSVSSEVRLLSPKVILCLTTGGVVTLFSEATPTFYIPSRDAQVSHFSTSLQSLFSHFLIIAFLTAGKVKQYLTVGLVCISLTASDVEHLLMHHLGLRIQTNMKILGQTQQKSQYKALPWWSSG